MFKALRVPALCLAIVCAFAAVAQAAQRELITEKLKRLAGKGIKPATKVWLSRSRNGFELFVRAEEPAMNEVVAKTTRHDGRVWLDDSVTVFIDAARNRERVYFVSVNVAGVTADGWLDASEYVDLGWESKAKVTVKKGKDYWSASFRLSYPALGAVPAPGDRIGFDVMRRRLAGAAGAAAISPRELRSGKFKSVLPEPAGFASFSVGAPKGKLAILSASRGALDPTRPNAGWFRAVAVNREKTPVKLVVEVRTLAGKKLAQNRFTALAGATTPLNTFYGGDFSAGDKLVFTVKREGASVPIYRSRWSAAEPLGRRVYEKEGTFDESLLVKGRTIPDRYAAMTWPQGAGIIRMTSFGLRNGVEWSCDAYWKALSGEYTVPIQSNDRPTAGGQYGDIVQNAALLRANNLKVLFIPNGWEIDGRRDYWMKLGVYGGYKADPDYVKKYFESLRKILTEYKDLVWGVFINDEMHYTIIKNSVKLYEAKRNEYPYILKVDADVRKRFGYGKYGIPHSLNDKTKWRWVALKRWTVDFVDKFERKVAAEARKLKRDIVIVSVDPQGEVQPFDVTRWRDGRCDVVSWQSGAAPYPRQTRPSLIPKFVHDLARPKELWPCIHAEHAAASYTPAELRAILSHALASGATGLHFFPLDGRGKGNLGNLERYGAPARWAYWVKAAKFFSAGWRVRLPEGTPGAALFFSNDSHMALPAAWSWTGLVSPPYAYLALKLKSDFEFIDEGGIERGFFKPEDYKLIVVPYADVVRPAVVARFVQAVKAGATMLITDPKAFRFDLDGTETLKWRKELLGSIRLEKTPNRRRHARTEPVAFLSKAKLDFDVIEPTFWELVGTTYIVHPGKGDTVLIRYRDGAPAAVIHPLGKGRVIWVGFNIYQSNFDKPPDRKTFSVSAEDFMRALLADCGVKMNLRHYDAMLPPPDPFKVELPGVCLTDNSVVWLRSRPLALADAEVGARYTYDRFPDKAKEKVASGWIPVGKGTLTDRGRLWSEKKATKDCSVAWATPEAVSLTFDLAATRELAEANVYVSGAAGTVTLSAGDSLKRLKQVGEEKIDREIIGIEKVSFRFENTKARYVRFTFGPRPQGAELRLAEADVWGKVKY